MKLKNILIVGTLLGGASLAHADERTFGDGTLPEFLRQYDVNEDGFIDEEERQAIKDTRKDARDQRRAEIDTDGDGKISHDEREAAREAIRAKIAEKRTEKFSNIAGEDGVLSLEEFATLPPLARASKGRVASIFARLDDDESGDVSLEEFNARLRKYGNPLLPGNGNDDARPIAPPELPIGGLR
ncbi:MAG: Ca2+-binding EF-hand superfamily protein [Akkermansiaceae bacterium]|jgi:Ca2+-binding EF-hand superfamily protein